MHIFFNEQDIANAVCVFVADLERTQPENVEIEFQFDEEEGVRCIAKTHRDFFYGEQQIADSIGFFLEEFHNFESHSMEILLGFDEDNGVTSQITIT